MVAVYTELNIPFNLYSPVVLPFVIDPQRGPSSFDELHLKASRIRFLRNELSLNAHLSLTMSTTPSPHLYRRGAGVDDKFEEYKWFTICECNDIPCL